MTWRIHAASADGLRLWVMTQPGPVKSNTNPSPDFSICTMPELALRSWLVTVGPNATTWPLSMVTDSPAPRLMVSRAP